jgi:hypothetical protein
VIAFLQKGQAGPSQTDEASHSGRIHLVQSPGTWKGIPRLAGTLKDRVNQTKGCKVSQGLVNAIKSMDTQFVTRQFSEWLLSR